jgi:hypothetical protein
MARHSFNFDGGNYLTRIGASWFISYSFYCYKDKSHMNWQKVSTYKFRISVFNRTKNYHKFWYGKILEMDNHNLNRNEIDLDAIEIKNMTKKLLGTKL